MDADAPAQDASTPLESPTPRSARRRLLFLFLCIVLLSTVALAVLIMIFENRIIFVPTKYPAGDWDAPARATVPFEDVWLETSDGVKIHGWMARGKGARATILYFHGNAGNLTHRADWIEVLTRLPADVLAIDYRGYGRSEGAPNEAGIYRDAEAAYAYLTETRGVAPQQLIIYGVSLGGAPACEIAWRRPCAGLIVQSAFTNAGDMASRMIPILPMRWLVRARFDNAAKIARVRVPKLIVHGRDDEVVPYEMGKRLYEAAVEPKKLIIFDDAGHNDLVWLYQPQLTAAFRSFIESSVPEERSPGGTAP